MQEDDDDYSTEFLSPSKSPKKRLTVFGRKDDGGKELSPFDRRRLSMLSHGQLKRLSIFPKKSPKDAERVESERKEKADLSALLSPRLEQEIQKRERTRRKTNFMKPLTSLKESTNNILRSSFHGILPFRDKGDNSDASSSVSGSEDSEDTEYEIEDYKVDGGVNGEDDNESDDPDEEITNVAKIATEDDMMLLLCRELELITGDEEAEEYDDDDDE